jgi:hypothetical protein
MDKPEKFQVQEQGSGPAASKGRLANGIGLEAAFRALFTMALNQFCRRLNRTARASSAPLSTHCEG